MGEVTAYIGTIEGVDRDALERVYAIARGIVPEAEEGTSYGMPALLYRGKGGMLGIPVAAISGPVIGLVGQIALVAALLIGLTPRRHEVEISPMW